MTMYNFYWNKNIKSHVSNGVITKGVTNERKDNRNNSSNFCGSIIISSSVPK